MTAEDFADTQGLVRFGYRTLTKATYTLLRVKDAAAARAWLRTAEVTSAAWQPAPPKSALHVALTAPGLRALGVADSVLAGFSHEFRGGMAQESRSRTLGDLGASAPACWAWGAPGREPHLLVMFFAEPGGFEASVREAKGSAWSDAFEELETLPTSDLGETEPFGFADGISQPWIDWEQQRPVPRTELEYRNEAALGEFLLGYRNEYGKYTERPLLEPGPASAALAAAEEEPAKRDLGRNGTYLVLRQLHQDVRGFWQSIYGAAQGDPAAAEALAAAVVGRTRDGNPLVPSVGKNDFTFAQDPQGSRCPFGSHLRRANPRNSDFPPGTTGWLRKLLAMIGFGPRGFRDDLMSSVRFHRILRRGREYGSKLTPEQALANDPASGEGRGLNFICLNASISRQFEFLQNAWLAGTKFSGLSGESDPLLGNREPIPSCPVTSAFTWPREDGVPRRFTGLPQFVTVRGGAYFFLPSLRALRFFCTEKPLHP